MKSLQFLGISPAVASSLPSLLVKLWNLSNFSFNFRIIIIEFLKKLIPALAYVSAFQFDYNKRKIVI